jgi:hypothetical protein
MATRTDPAARRARTDKEARKQYIAAAYLQGHTQRQIAQHLGLTPGRVSQLLDEIRADWQRRYLADFDAKVQEELARLDQAEREAWQAWQDSRSMQEITTAQEQETPTVVPELRWDSKGKPVRLGVVQTLKATRATVQRRQRDGDPRFLLVITRCVDQRCKLLGLYAPARVQVNLEDQVRALAREVALREGLDEADLIATALAIAAAEQARHGSL